MLRGFSVSQNEVALFPTHFNLHAKPGTPWIIENINGLGPVPANVTLSPAAGRHGAIFNTAKIAHRVIDITFVANTAQDVEKLRHEMYRVFPPSKWVALTFYSEHRTVVCEGYVASCDTAIFGEAVKVTVGVQVPDPFFKSVAPELIHFEGMVDGFTFPFHNTTPPDKNLQFATIRRHYEKSFDYDGEVPTGVYGIISCLGPVRNISIKSLINPAEVLFLETDRISQSLGGLTTGDVISFSTMPGNKFIRLKRGAQTYNQYHIQRGNRPMPMVWPGLNTLQFSAESGIENLRYELSYYKLYRGV